MWALKWDRPKFGSLIQSATCSWQGPRSLPVGSGDCGQWGSPGWALATLGRKASHPVFSQSRGLGALPGAFQAPQPLLSRLRHRAGASPGQSRAGGCGLVALGAARVPRTVGTQGQPEKSDLPSPAARLSGKMGPGSQHALVLLLLLLASPGARAFQVSVPAVQCVLESRFPRR